VQKRGVRKVNIKYFTSLKAVTLVFVATVLASLFVQSASAMVDIWVIDTKYGYVYSEDNAGYFGILCDAKFESWDKEILTNMGSSEFRWITVGYGGTAYIKLGSQTNPYMEGMGTISISFSSYITINYVEVTLYAGSGTYTITSGGVGKSFVTIYVVGVNFWYPVGWYLYIKTNNIPKNYWGSTTGISLTAKLVNGPIDSDTISLKI